MAKTEFSFDQTQDSLYQKMMTSQGGVMLLVRLHADLASEPLEFIRRMRVLDLEAQPAGRFAQGSRLAVTFDWLTRQFGQRNAVRAVTEAAREVLGVLAKAP